MNSLTPRYVDVDKPRDFDSRQNGIINFTLGNFVKVYDVHGWPEVSGDGVTDAYQILNLYDDWAANATSSVKSGANRIGRCRVVQLRRQSTALDSNITFGTSPTITGGVYDMWFMDVQMFTVLNIANPVTYKQEQESQVKLLVLLDLLQILVITHITFIFEQVNGVFSNGEILQVNGRDVGTLEAAHSYQLSDVRSSFGLMVATSQIWLQLDSE